MPKKFHIQGPCHPDRHYMADTARQLKLITAMIEQGDYFMISRPRQYGKTTTLNLLIRALSITPNYLVLPISFEGIGDKVFENEERFCEVFLNLLKQRIQYFQKELLPFINNLQSTVKDFSQLSVAITNIVNESDKRVILLIDEVDQSSNHQLFLAFLGVLRDKFIDAQDEWGNATFHSVILAGVHDIKHLKLKIRSEEDSRLNSPWNIAAEFKVDMSLLPVEIVAMLKQYTQESGVAMDTKNIANALYQYTAGYPFLVSKICKVVAEELLPKKQKKEWTIADTETAINQVIKEDNFNFDSLTKNLENHPDLFDLIYRILLGGEQLSFNAHNPTIKLGILYGIFKEAEPLTIHNKVYEQVIYEYMLSKVETAPNARLAATFDPFVLPDHRLDMDGILRKFQEVIKEEYSQKDQRFIEREGRLLFLSFLKPILNGKGFTFKEPQISAEKRLDIVITFLQQKYIVELKLWYGIKAHEKGLQQLADYLERQHQDKGWLLIFDHRRKKSWEEDSDNIRGKEIFMIWV